MKHVIVGRHNTNDPYLVYGVINCPWDYYVDDENSPNEVSMNFSDSFSVPVNSTAVQDANGDWTFTEFGSLQIVTATPIPVQTVAQISALTVDQIEAQRPGYFRGLTPAQVVGFSATQMAAMSVAQLGQFTKASVDALTTAQKANLSADQLAALNRS